MTVVLILLALFLAACGEPQAPVRIDFEVRANGEPIDCEHGPGGAQLADLRLYVHDIELIDGEGGSNSLTLIADGRWQSTDVAMLDFENGQGTCANGSVATNASITGTWTGNTVRGLRFTLGVPENLNHGNPLTADPPLGDSAMHWHWASGYKFIRAGGVGTQGGFAFHLGSNRCEGTIGSIRGCRGANRARVALDEFDPESQLVVIDVGRWFSAGSLNPRCMSAPDNLGCQEYFAAVGLDFVSGESVSTDSIFSPKNR